MSGAAKASRVDHQLPINGSTEHIEQAILGILLAFGGIDRVRHLSPDVFKNPVHERYFRGILSLPKNGSVVHIPLLRERLVNDLAWDETTFDHLQDLLYSTPRNADLSFYLQELEARQTAEKCGETLRALAAAVESGDQRDAVGDLWEATQSLMGRRSLRSRAPLRALDLRDALTGTIEPIPWALPGWLTQGARFNFVADGGAGKSYMGLDLAVALSRRGGKWMSSVPVLGGPYRVLFVDNENPERLVRHRLQALCLGLNVSVDEFAELPFRYLVENHINMDDPAGLAQLRSELETFKPDWVLCDSLIRFHRRDENSNSEMAAFFNDVIGPLCTEYGCGWGFLHHTCKAKTEGGGVGHRGASDLRNCVDHQWGMRFDRQSGTRQLFSEKDRWDQKDPAPVDVQFQDTDDGQGFRIIATEGKVAGKDTVLRLLEDAGQAGVLRADLLTAIGGRDNDRTLSRALKDLYGEMEIRKDGNRRGMRYWLTVFAPRDAA